MWLRESSISSGLHICISGGWVAHRAEIKTNKTKNKNKNRTLNHGGFGGKLGEEKLGFVCVESIMATA